MGIGVPYRLRPNARQQRKTTMHSDDLNAPPFNPIAPVVWVFVLAIVGVELALQAAESGFLGGANGIGWRIEAFSRFAFFDTALSWMMETGRFPVEHLQRFITYPFIHGNFTHALFAVVMLLAIGKMVAEVFSAFAFVAIFMASTIVGALTYALFLETNIPLLGAFPAVYGMIGAFTFVLWVRARHEGEGQARAFSLIAFLMGLQLFFKLVFGGGDDWIADIAGFVTGFGLSFVLAPGGARRIAEMVNQIRRRR
ncbi:MAG: rhomboid protease GluP [Paracoccaceae bacterium]|jgi:rhomboid protease GluP